MACSKLEARGHLLHKTGTPPKHFSRECIYRVNKSSNLIPLVFSAHFVYLSFFSVNCDSQLEELKSELKDKDEEIKSLKEQLDSQNKHPVSN